MKNMILFVGLTVGFLNGAQAQVTSVPGQKFREFDINITVASGEVKSALLQVNTALLVNALGEPEIPNHGHYDYFINGSVVEGEKRCNFEVLLTQTKLKQESTADILKSNTDRAGSVKLCSGLSIEIGSLRSLLTDSSLMIGLKAPGLVKKIGTGTLTSNGLKTVPEWEPYED
jgi:hypothetical protein